MASMRVAPERSTAHWGNDSMHVIRRSLIFTSIIADVAFSQPKLYVDRTEINMGTIYSGDKKRGEFTLKNVGTDTLHIFAVAPSCGCTTVKSAREFLAPGDSDTVEFDFSPHGFPGIQEKDIVIYTNDPTAREIGVGIIADLREVLQSTRGANALYFVGNAAIHEPVTRRISLTNGSGQPLAVLRDSVSSPSITATMDKKIVQPDDTLNVDVTVLPEKPGLTDEALYIITDHALHPDVEVKITILGTQGN